MSDHYLCFECQFLFNMETIQAMLIFLVGFFSCIVSKGPTDWTEEEYKKLVVIRLPFFLFLDENCEKSYSPKSTKSGESLFLL